MKKIAVAAAVIRDGDKLFATQRGYGPHKDRWESPGGKIEEGETPEQALCREIREELETEIRVEKRIARIEQDDPEFHLTMDCFFCRVLSGKLTLLEHENSAWLSLDDLDQMDWLPADRKLIRYIREQF